jgi:hypothetical protein
VETPEPPLVQKKRHDVLYVRLLGVVPEVHQNLRLLPQLLAGGERCAPVGEVRVVEGRLVGLVLQQQPHALGHRRVDLVQTRKHPVSTLHEGVLPRIVRAVGEPQGEHVRADFLGYSDAL